MVLSSLLNVRFAEPSLPYFSCSFHAILSCKMLYPPTHITSYLFIISHNDKVYTCICVSYLIQTSTQRILVHHIPPFIHSTQPHCNHPIHYPLSLSNILAYAITSHLFYICNTYSVVLICIQHVVIPPTITSLELGFFSFLFTLLLIFSSFNQTTTEVSSRISFYDV